MSYSEIVKYHMVVCNILLLDKFLSEIKKLSPNTLLISQKHLESYLSLQQNEQLESNMLNYIINGIGGGLCIQSRIYHKFLSKKQRSRKFFNFN